MLGSFYEKAWDLDRQLHTDPDSLTYPFSKKASQARKGFRLRPKMHLRKSDETMRCGGAVGVDETRYTNGSSTALHEHKTERPDSTEDVNEVVLSVPYGLDLDAVSDCILASWILLVLRYQREPFQLFNWRNGLTTEDFQSIETGPLDLPEFCTGAELLDKMRGTRSTNVILVCDSSSTIILRDGTKDEWTYEISIQFKDRHLLTASNWQPPSMSRWQAISHLRAFGSIANTLFRDPQSAVSSIMAISENEIDSIWKWNSPLPSNLETCMHEIVSEQAQMHPEKMAVESWDGNLSYGQLDQFSTELAQNLRLLDDSENLVVPVLFEKSRWTMVAVLAIMKAGACFALLDPAQPEGRLRSVVQQTKATIMVASKAQSALAARVAPGATVVPVSQSKFTKLYRPFAEQQPYTSLPDVSPSSWMYIQFTSGSTGSPKGCILSHSNYTSGAIPRAYTVGYRSHSRVLDFASYAFDVSIDSMLCTLSVGATLCTPSDERRMNDLSGAMRDMRVNLAGMTPSVARTLDPDILPSLDSLAVGGEGISASDAKNWSKLTKVVNCYGPSECTVGATYSAGVGTKPYISMGKGTGCAVWVTDPENHNKLLPPGAVGELLIEGPIVGNGYLNNPTKTDEVFIEDPAFLLAGSRTLSGRRGRCYKTGDLVRYDPDGNGEIIFVGRQDQQVKLRGQRIELAEIEYNMKKNLPLETQLTAEVIKPGGSGEPTLVAFIVEHQQNGMKHLDGNIFGNFSNGFKKELQDMTRKLSEDLPVYMVPAACIPLWKMPLLVSCKTDRKRLREIGASITRRDLRQFSATISARDEPSSEMEIQLGKLWADVLGGDSDFSSNDNFFSMGGDSLRAMKLVAAARERGIGLPVADILLNPTLSAMASRAKTLEETQAAEIPAYSLLPSDWSTQDACIESAQLCGVKAETVEDVYPCTPLQEGLMALSAKFTDAYVAQRVLELPRHAAERLMEAIERVARDSPILRTRIVNIPSRGLFQVVLSDGQLLRNHGADIKNYLELDREEPMELGKALFRYGIIYSPDGVKAQIAITMHHAVYDGWSMPLIFERVDLAYQGRELSRSVSFKHFIKHLNQLDPSASHEYWRTRLDGASPYQFPSLPYKGHITQADSLLEHYVAVPTTAHNNLTLATTIRGAWALVSSLYIGHGDIVFGETLTGRSAPVAGIEQIEGPMITTIPIRVKLNLGKSISEFLHTVHAQTVQQIPHEHLGLQNIRRLSRDARDACELRTGLVLHPKEDSESNTAQNVEDAPANSFLPSDDTEAAKEALKFNTYALMLVCTLDENGFLIMASFDSNCIPSPAMERVLKVLERVITAFLGNPESKLGDVAVLDSQEVEDSLAINPKNIITDNTEAEQENTHAKDLATTQTQELTPNERKLRELLGRILGIPESDVSLSDSFFELGGDSISAMRLVSEARSQGVKLTVAQIFQHSSVAELAAVIGVENEEKLIDLLSRVMGLPKGDIKAEDSFFELGGDSIAAMRLVAEARAQGLDITVTQIFQSKSLSELASLAAETSSRETPATAAAPFAALGENAHLFSADRIQALLENPNWDIENVYPVRPLQQVAVDGTVELPRYSLRYELIKLGKSIHRARLAQSCQELVARNEVLRTVFVRSEGKCLGVVLGSLQPSYAEVSVPEEMGVDDFMGKYINSDIQGAKPYGSSFVAFTLFVSNSGDSTLAFRISHAQYDEICLPLLFHQFSALYAGHDVPKTQPFTKHVNHVVQRNIQQSIPYWRELLAGSRMSVFKPDIPLSDRKSSSIYREFDISSRPHNITIGSLPTAAWAVVLAKRLGTRDVVFGEVVTGRNLGIEAADRIIGPTWQYVPIRVPFKSIHTYEDLLRFIQNQHVESSFHEGMGLSEIVQECTDWNPNEVTWFDSVVHQAPQDWVEKMQFGDTEAHFETVYPHAEPLREWKVQAFVQNGGKTLGIEVVTFEEWKGVGEEVLQEIGEALNMLMTAHMSGNIFVGNEDQRSARRGK